MIREQRDEVIKEGEKGEKGEKKRRKEGRKEEGEREEKSDVIYLTGVVFQMTNTSIVKQ